MATYYWVGGSGNWDATSTTNWASSSGGSGGAGVPTSADNVIFDANSNTGTNAFTVTVTGTSSAPAVCNDFSTGGAGGALDGAMTLSMGATAVLDCYGSMTLPATNLTASGTGSSTINFKATTTGKTLTTNGVTLTTIFVVFDGVGGEWTLGSALTISNTGVAFINGSFLTGNYNITATGIQKQLAGTITVSLGSSSLTLSGSTTVNFSIPTGLTLNAGTSTITCSAASPTFNGGGLTFYNVTFSSAANGTTVISGANTFNNLTQTSRSATGQRFVTLLNNQTVSGTLTLGAANTAVRRIFIRSDILGTQRTITLNGTLATLADVDFRDINAAGSVATPWTGTRLGDCLGNSNITLTAAKTVYWNLAGTQNWSATGWATTNNGTPAANNFPLAQDTAVFTEAGSAGTVTIDAPWQIGAIQMADGVSNRTTAFTLATGTQAPSIYLNVTLFSSLTLTGTGTITFSGRSTQVITSAGISWTQPITVLTPSGTFQLADNLTNTGTAFTLTSGTLDLDNKTLTCNTFSSSNSNTRSIAFGTSGQITVTGNNTVIWSTAIAGGFTYTGTPKVVLNYSGSTGTRQINHGTTSGATETNSPSFYITAGTDIFTIGSNGSAQTIDFSGFAGSTGSPRTIYGNLIFASGMTVTDSIVATTFAATSGTQQITTNGVTIDFPITVNAPGATVQLQDALTLGSTRTLTLTAGTLNANNQNVSTGLFSSSNSNTRTLTMGSGSWTITGTGSVWNITNSTNLTLNKDTANITLSDTSTSARTFAGGGKTYNNLVIGGATGTSTLTITGSNTFDTISSTKTVAHTITLPASGTTTVSNWTASGSSGNTLTINSSTPGTSTTLTKTGGGSIAGLSYLDIKDIAATPSGAWFAGPGSINSGNNTGWVFSNNSFVMLI